MGRHEDKARTDGRLRNMQVADDRLELLDTISRMISEELDRRGVVGTHSALRLWRRIVERGG